MTDYEDTAEVDPLVTAALRIQQLEDRLEAMAEAGLAVHDENEDLRDRIEQLETEVQQLRAQLHIESHMQLGGLPDQSQAQQGGEFYRAFQQARTTVQRKSRPVVKVNVGINNAGDDYNPKKGD